ncbi:MAG TPA: protein translocase subunit SecF [Thermodesulfobacteriota bacterium]|nr:protein translocase subunit SecF [Thermodesulfobacteriota bacterium]
MDLIKPDTKINFIRMMKPAALISLLAMLISIGSLIYHKGPEWGVEFTGGTEIQIKLAKDVGPDDIRDTLEDAGYPTDLVQRVGIEGDREYLIRFTPDVVKFEQIQDFQKSLGELVKTNPIFEGGSILRVDYIGPNVGSELVTKAILAILLGCVGILIYVMLRFEFAFALGAVLALFHDALIALGALSLMDKDFTLTIVAALLTIIGYSVNDTIIIFDRIRENLKKGAEGSFTDIVNLSINQTLSRTVLTNVTVFLVLIPLFFFGGSVIHDFAFVMIVGCIAGTYSTIFIASAIVIWWRKYKGLPV